jgi:Na+/phosphate symporter
MNHDFREQRYFDFTCVRCRVCDMSPRSKFVLLTCEEELQRKEEFKSEMDKNRKTFDDLTKAIREYLEEVRDQQMTEHEKKWLSICEKRAAEGTDKR